MLAYTKAGYRVVVLCDLGIDRARVRQEEFYPDAAIYSDYRKLLKRDDIAVDIAARPH